MGWPDKRIRAFPLDALEVDLVRKNTGLLFARSKP
jgi:hypothetical protein